MKNYLVEKIGMAEKILEMAKNSQFTKFTTDREKWNDFLDFLEVEIKYNHAYTIRMAIEKVTEEIKYQVSATGMLEYTLRSTKNQNFNLKRFNSDICYFSIISLLDEFEN